MPRSHSLNREEEAEPEEEEEDMSSTSQDWAGLFDRTRTVPPHCQTVHLVHDSHLITRSEGFQLTLSRVVNAAHLQQQVPAENSEEQQDFTYQLRVSLFDWTHQHFFGRTWKSSPQRMKSGHKIQFNEVLYFHTSLRLASTVAVLELVATSLGPDGSQQHLGCGFTVLELFAGKAEARRLSLHHGTPRSLLHPLLKNTEYDNILNVMDGAHLDCVVKGHPALGSVMHLLPENMLVSGHQDIPGLTPSPTGDALLRPQLLDSWSYTLDRLSVSLQPSLEALERRLLQLVNEDCHNTKQLRGPEGGAVPLQRTVAIQERRLHVGVHNGWGFLDKPQVVVLHPQQAAGSRRTRAAGSVSRHSTTATTPTKDSSPCRLALRSSLELRLTNHEALAIVFQLEYVFSAQLGRDAALSTTTASRAAFMQCLRWGAWSPFQGGDWTGEEVQLALQGGSSGATMPNPYGVMVYSADAPPPPTTSENPAEPGSAAPASMAQEVGDDREEDMVRFHLWSTAEGKALSPKASLRTRRQRQRQEEEEEEEEEAAWQRRPPSLGQKPPPLASPPASPQGPGLSLSQLAATSRYPTISHSSSAAALAWQQQPFPALLHPSPLASAHQLSHVACPAASNIAHLEVDLMPNDDGVDITSIDGDAMSELPFTPVHAPVISLGMHVSSSCSASSRSSLAHLYSAGFPDILGRSGEVAEVLDPTEPTHFDPQREEADPLSGNLMVFQFLAFSRIGTSRSDAAWPDSVHFTFQFYRFPPVTTQQLQLLTAAKDKSPRKTNTPLPCVLASLNKDDTCNSGCPGLQVQFLVDESFLRPGEKRWFLRYLALHTMQVDVWDSSSLLLIGSTAIELKHMLRQGREAVQALHEVEVLTTDYVGEEDTPSMRSPAAPPLNVHTLVRGRLHVRTGNVGCPMDPKPSVGRELPPPRSHIITPHASTVGFSGGSLAGRSTVQRRNARNVARAQRLVEVDGDLVALLNGGGIKDRSPLVADGHRSADEPGDMRRRKLERMAAVHRQEAQKDAEGQVKTATRVMTRREERARLDRDLRVIEAYQDRSKTEGIANMLSQAITTQHVLYASLGIAEYMEFVLKNPYNVPQTIRIHSEDPELSVITSTEEWRYFKELTRSPTPLEEDMFHVGEDESAPPRVYLRPKESVHIPLKYQSFLCDHNMAPQGPSFISAGESAQVAKRHPSNIMPAKSIKVTFRAEDGRPLAVCQVTVEPTPHVIDQSFRLYHPERCFLKKAIRLPPWHHSPPDTPVSEPGGGRHLSVRCSDPNVICQTKMLAPGEPQDVYLKVPGCPSPQVKMFYVMVYTDKWLAAPAQVWQVYVHFLERVDVSCVAGQRSCQSLVLRGRQAARKVKCFSSHPREIEVDPAGVFVLPPGAVQELRLRVQAWRAGSRFLYVHAVDVEQRRLVTAWLLCLNIHRPVLSKAFEVAVPVGGGKGSSRRLTYTNPYTSSRDFTLRSDHPDLLQFKEDHFQLGGGESYTIGLRFAPCHNAGSAEIMVYVNDLDEKTEETFCVKVIYS